MKPIDFDYASPETDLDRYAISGASWAAWKSIECRIVPLLAKMTLSVCLWRTRESVLARCR
jgi:hypothetical protein